MLMNSERPARLHYQANGFRVLSPGNHVICAVSGARVALEDLRYWSPQRQEAYASAQIASEALSRR